jgi:hypothetical protein
MVPAITTSTKIVGIKLYSNDRKFLRYDSNKSLIKREFEIIVKELNQASARQEA